MVYVSFCCISRYRPRNTRIRRVQAKRKALDLSQDGNCCGLRTRRASLALRKAEQDFYDGRRSGVPETSEFEHWTARKQRKDKRRMLKWKPLILSDEERAFIAQYSYDPLFNPFGVTEQDLGELSNVNRP